MIWPTKKLGEVAKIQNGFAFKSSEYTTPGFFVMRITNVQDGFIELNNPKYIKEEGKDFKKFVLNEGDILISLTGNVGRVGVIQKDHLPAVLNQRVAKITVADPNLLDWKYLFHCLKSPFFITKVIEMGHGMAQKNVSTKDIENLEIPLPPLSEQKKIVAKLERVLQKISEAKKLRAEALKNADNLLPAELHKIFTTPYHTHTDKLENVGMSSTGKNGWEEKTIEEVTELVTKGTTPKTLGHAYTESGVPFLKAENVNGGVIDASSTQTFISKQTHDILSRSKTKNGDVLMTIAGTIGRLGWVPEHTPEMNMNQAVAIIRPKRNLISSPYLVYILSAGISQSQVSSGIVKAAIPNFSLGMIKKIKIPLPPLAEQKKIVARLDSLSEKIGKIKNLQSVTQNGFAMLERSILSKAFRAP